MITSAVRGTRKATVALTALLTVLAGSTAYATAGDESGPLRRLSAGDPVAACTAGGTAGRVTPNSSESSAVAVNPADPRQSIVTWAQDSWSAPGGARADVYAYTRDGVHFTEGVLPFGACAGAGSASPGFGRVDLPRVSWGPDGVAYAAATEIDFTTGASGNGVAASFDGGATWKYAQSLRESTFPPEQAGQATVTADPTRPGTAYLVSDQLDETPPRNVDDPAVLSVTHDHGRTWSAPRVIVDTAKTPMTGAQADTIVVDPRTGRLYDFFLTRAFVDPTLNHFAVVKSDDGGATWTDPQPIAPMNYILDTDPDNPAQRLLTSEGQISAAIDPLSGTLYATFEGTDFSSGAFNQAELVESTDGGATWSTPTLISTDPKTPAYDPAIAVGPTGTVSVLYYDLRHLPQGDTTTLPTATWLDTFPFGNLNHRLEQQVAPDFDWLQAPAADGHYIGVYEGLAPAGMFGVRVAFVATLDAPTHPSDVYTKLVEPFGPAASPLGFASQATAADAAVRAEIGVAMSSRD